MLVKFETDHFTDHVARLNRIKDWLSQAGFSRKPLKETGDLVVSIIRERTSAGMGLDRTPFEPLEYPYSHRKRRRTGNMIPDLRYSGEMMRGMRHWISRGSGEARVRVGFINKELKQRAIFQESRIPTQDGHIPARQFMGLTRGEKFRATLFLSDRIQADMKKNKIT